ncbi:MAG TPA: protease inhibitor I42 family protein [Methanoregulaceae archaeon]|nr:protease inhibitor I42 family protein [Methanoregulaceae archaeon]
MNKPVMRKGKYFAVAAISILCIAVIATAGCTGKGQTPMTEKPTVPTPEGTAIQPGHLVITEEQNNATIPVKSGDQITLMLPENPTTGYTWNLTTTRGLNQTGDRYTPSDRTGTLVGSGGTHVWQMTVTGTGDQAISGIYKRSWEPVTGNETTFRVALTVR